MNRGVETGGTKLQAPSSTVGGKRVVLNSNIGTGKWDFIHFNMGLHDLKGRWPGWGTTEQKLVRQHQQVTLALTFSLLRQREGTDFMCATCEAQTLPISNHATVSEREPPIARPTFHAARLQNRPGARISMPTV
jgi:hypothetical protein